MADLADDGAIRSDLLGVNYGHLDGMQIGRKFVDHWTAH